MPVPGEQTREKIQRGKGAWLGKRGELNTQVLKKAGREAGCFPSAATAAATTAAAAAGSGKPELLGNEAHRGGGAHTPQLMTVYSYEGCHL